MTFSVKIATSESARAECYRLRHIVFVEEQGVPVEMEIDEHDETIAVHFLGEVEGEAVAAGRMIFVDEVAKLGRLVVLKRHRGKNYGVDLMDAMMAHAKANLITKTVGLDAQTYATQFYEKLGFVEQGQEFLDAGIPHIHMVCELS